MSVAGSPFLDLYCLLDMEAQVSLEEIPGQILRHRIKESRVNFNLHGRPNSPHCRPDLLQGSTARPNFTVPGVVHHQKNVSVTPAVLSLLSIQPRCNRSRLGMTSFHGTITSTLIDQPLINRGAAIITQYACPCHGLPGVSRKV